MLRFFIILAVSGIAFASCSPNNLEEDESLEKYFAENNLTGTFGMFDNGIGLFTVYNLDRYRDSAYLPASTFKIVNSLVAIETGVAKDDSVIIKWDGVQRSVSNWNQDLTMTKAFEYSSVPYFQEIARRIGRDTMKQWLDTLGYLHGVDISSNIDTFWLDNSVKITADEQLGLVKRLYFDQLPFQKRTQRIVRQMMVRESNSNYILSYKTAWGITEKGHALGWVVGWIEENKRPYFFVLQVESPDRNYDLTTIRVKILKDILTQYGFFQGKK